MNDKSQTSTRTGRKLLVEYAVNYKSSAEYIVMTVKGLHVSESRCQQQTVTVHKNKKTAVY
jgi:hypothetical protein